MYSRCTQDKISSCCAPSIFDYVNYSFRVLIQLKVKAVEVISRGNKIVLKQTRSYLLKVFSLISQCTLSRLGEASKDTFIP